MTRTTSLRGGSQIVMWSSPLLLLVMLFSMTTSARSTTALTHVGGSRAPLTRTSRPRALPKTSSPSTTSPVTTTDSTTSAPPRRTTPPATRAPSSVAAIDSSVNSAAFNPGASAVSGSVSGVVDARGSLEVPLTGPGAWRLSASVPVESRLTCPRTNTSFANQIVIDSAQTCQLSITSTGGVATWQLTPEP